MNKLNAAFESAICTQPVPAGETVTCQCGQTTKSTLEAPARIGTFIGADTIVAGCSCDYVSTFGNFIWQYRHPIAGFLRGMSDALEDDRRQLVGTLPEVVK